MKPISQRLLELTTRRGGQPDRGALANLRRGLIEPHLAWPYLDHLGIVPDDTPGVLTATFFGEYPQHTENRENIGATWRRIYDKRRKKRDQTPTDPEQIRFRRLIACDAKELPDHLLAVVRFAKDEGIPLNYDSLFWDLREWVGCCQPKNPHYPVKLRWACAFHQAATDDDSADEPAQAVSQ